MSDAGEVAAVDAAGEPWVRTIGWHDATGTLKQAYDWQAKGLGEPSEFTRLGSLYPELVMERLRLYKVVEETPSDLTEIERRLAAFVTSTVTGTVHCSSGVAVRLNDEGTAPSLLEQIRTNPLSVDTGDERTDAVVSYAAKLTAAPAMVEEADVIRLRTAGLSDLGIVDLNNIVAYYNYTNRVANGLGLRTEIPEVQARSAVPV